MRGNLRFSLEIYGFSACLCDDDAEESLCALPKDVFSGMEKVMFNN